MPKRKKYNEEYILRKIKKLERSIRRQRNENEEYTSDDETPTTPACSPELISPLNEEPLEEEPIDASIEPETIVVETIEQDTTPNVEELDESIMKVLGKNYEKPQEMGPKIHNELADRWENIIQKGLDKEEKENILKQKYCLPPENCPHLTIPKMNPETLAACTEQNKKRDYLIETRQKLLSASIAGLAYATDKVLLSVEPQELKLNLLEILNNSSKILTDIIFNENKSRRALIVSGLDKEIRDTLFETKPDKYLFGDNLHDKFRTAKSVGKTGREIRLQPKSIPKPSPPKGNQLNWRGPPRQTQRQKPLESRPNKNRSSGPRQTSLKRAPPAPPRNYRKQNSSSNHQQRN